MARSSFIYVVDWQGGPLVAAFTVKHELVTWLRRHRSNTMWSVYRVTRLRDGNKWGDPEPPVVMSVVDLVAEPDANV